MNFSTGQRLAGPYSAPGFRPKIGCEIFPNQIFSSSPQFLPARRTIAARAVPGFAPSAAARCRYSWIWCAPGCVRISRFRISRLPAARTSWISATESFRIFTAPERGGDGLRQEKIPPRARIADALWNSGQTNFQRRARRIGQHQREIKCCPARKFLCRADGKHIFAGGKGNRLVHRRMVEPQIAQFFRREQRDVRIGKYFPQPQQRGRGHHGVAQPVRPANQNSRSRRQMADGQMGEFTFNPFQRRWTQNQFAGSRRTAISNARFTSRMMSSVGRGLPFSCVGICSPKSSRHFASATR